MNKKNVLVIVANASESIFLDGSELRNGDLKELYKLEHPDSRKKNSELVTDRAGRVQKDGNSDSAYESKRTPKDIEAERFSLELAKKVYDHYNANKIEHLVFIAPAHFYGFFIKHWHHHNPNLHIEHLAKDYTKYTVKELTIALREHLFAK